MGMVGCDDKENSRKSREENYEIRDFSHTECKPRSKSGNLREYLELKAENKYLRIRHINAEFNCCPKELLINSKINNDTIFVYQNEKESSCNCVCKYDLNYKVGPLEYKTYHFVLNHMNSVLIEFDLDFDANTNLNSDIKLKGGACEYNEIAGKSKIVKITQSAEREGKLVKFHFTPNTEIQYLFPNIKDDAFLIVNGRKDISEEFIKTHNIVVGKEFLCYRKEITEGTCSPVVFDFPELKE